MKRPSFRTLKPVILAITIFVALTLKDLLIELTGGKIGDYLQKHSGITTATLVYCLIAILAIVFLYTLYEAFINTKETEEKKRLTENIEPDVKKFFDSLKERYQKRYESKLDERFEITLEVSEDWDGNKTQSFNERYDKDAKISEAFPKLKNLLDTKDGLLIVGEPGAGKTVLLLKVALNLLDKTNLAGKEAFPVIFNLASWSAEEYEDFGEWLKAMLVSGNGLSKDFAARLLYEQRLVLLLDGLDELARNEDKLIAAAKRAACLKVLNKYLDGEKNVICCRIDEFVEMQKNTAQDAPVSAKVEVLKLSEVEVLKALGHAQNHQDTKHHASAKNLSQLFIKEENAALRKVLCTPFYFTVALEVFYKRISEEINLPSDEEKLETYLIEKYVERKLDKTPNTGNFDKRNTKKWLKWLASLMQDSEIVTFELADLQPIDLVNKRTFILFSNFYIGIIISLIIGVYFSLPIGVCIGFTATLFCFLSADWKDFIIRTEDKIYLDFTEIFNLNFIVESLLYSGVLGLFLISLRNDGTSSQILAIFLIGIIIVFSVRFSLELHKIKKISGFTLIQFSYQRILGGFLMNLMLIISFLSATLFIEVFLGQLCLIHLMFIIPTFQILRKTAIIWHCILRLCLYFEGAMPLKYATFLDYAAEARVLEKDGGQWRFRHQNLQEYFAKLDNRTEATLNDSKR